MKPRAPAAKRATNVSINAELLERARAHGVNLSATLESAITETLRERDRAKWLEENRSAIAAYNQQVEDSGVFSDEVRSF
jgi:antitoxin CcdA